MSDYKMYVNGERVQIPTGHHVVLDASMTRSEIYLARTVPADIPGTRGIERFPVTLPEGATLKLRQDGHHVATFVERGGIAVDPVGLLLDSVPADRNDLNGQAKHKLHARVTILGDEDEGYHNMPGEVIRLHQTGDGPITYTVKEDATGKEWRCWDYDLVADDEQ